MLKKIVLEYGFNFHELALMTDGYSNSDLKELCRNAVMVPVRAAIKSANAVKDFKKEELKSVKIRPVALNDFMEFVDSLYLQRPVQEDLD